MKILSLESRSARAGGGGEGGGWGRKRHLGINPLHILQETEGPQMQLPVKCHSMLGTELLLESQ